MIEPVLRFSIKQRAFVLIAAVLLVASGGRSAVPGKLAVRGRPRKYTTTSPPISSPAIKPMIRRFIIVARTWAQATRRFACPQSLPSRSR